MISYVWTLIGTLLMAFPVVPLVNFSNQNIMLIFNTEEMDNSLA